MPGSESPSPALPEPCPHRRRDRPPSLYTHTLRPRAAIPAHAAMMLLALRLARADGLRQQVGVEKRGSVQDFEPDHLAVLPVEHDVGPHAFGRIDRDAIPPRRQLLIRQIDIRRIHLGIVGNPHGPIIHRSCQGGSKEAALMCAHAAWRTLVPHQATFARLVSSCRALSFAWRFRQAMYRR